MTAPNPKVIWRSMTDTERIMARAIQQITFVPGIGTKRFAEDIGLVAECDEPQITEAQARYLRQIVIRFRRQLRPETVALARGPHPVP